MDHAVVARHHHGTVEEAAKGVERSVHRQQHAHQKGVATKTAQTCSFTLTLSRTNGDLKDFNVQVTSAIDDVFHVQGCSQHGCDAKGFCAHQCMKQGAAGINAIKNQHGEDVGYGNCCGETNVVVRTEGCAETPLDSQLATDLAHRFPSIAKEVVKGAIRRAGGDVRFATEELRSLAPPPRMKAHVHEKPASTPRLRRDSSRSISANFKEEVQHVSQRMAPSLAIDQMREQAQQEQSAAEEGSKTSDPELRLVVKHMPQTGGTLLNSVLGEMLGQDHPAQYVDEHAPLKATGDKDYVISTMRNPCDWYVSLWASAPQTDRELLNVQYGTPDDPAPFFDLSNANRTKFSQWLNWAQGGRLSGSSVMSLRYWESLVAGTSAHGYSTTTLGSYTEGYRGREDVKAGLQTFAAESPVDCWVSNENFATDAQQCFSEYEERSGVHLDWEPFYQRLGGKGGHALSTGESSHRRTCSFYYDKDVAKSVLRSDDYLFRAFNFDTCCGPAK